MLHQASSEVERVPRPPLPCPAQFQDGVLSCHARSVQLLRTARRGATAIRADPSRARYHPPGEERHPGADGERAPENHRRRESPHRFKAIQQSGKPRYRNPVLSRCRLMAGHRKITSAEHERPTNLTPRDRRREHPSTRCCRVVVENSHHSGPRRSNRSHRRTDGPLCHPSPQIASDLSLKFITKQSRSS
jgi:hypothetical protein